jgi:hypothetical protein
LGRNQEAGRVERAYELFTGLVVNSGATTPTRRELLLAIDQAIWRGDLQEAADRALTVITPGELAARAALWGRVELARAQTKFVLAADPFDADARAAQLVSSPRGEDDREENSQVGGWQGDSASLSPVSVLLIVQHLRRTVGDAAAEHFLLQHRTTLRSAEDPLVETLISPRLVAEPDAAPSLVF